MYSSSWEIIELMYSFTVSPETERIIVTDSSRLIVDHIAYLSTRWLRKCPF